MSEEQFRRWLQSWCLLRERNLKDAIMGMERALQLPDAIMSPDVSLPLSNSLGFFNRNGLIHKRSILAGLNLHVRFCVCFAASGVSL